MRQYLCVYYQTDAGRAPVQEFIDSLHNRTQQKCFEVIELLEDFGKDLAKPHADYLGNEIFEMRFVGIEGQVRILYFFFHGNKAVFTNGFIKKQQKTPKIEIKLAIQRRAMYLVKHKESI